MFPINFFEIRLDARAFHATHLIQLCGGIPCGGHEKRGDLVAIALRGGERKHVGQTEYAHDRDIVRQRKLVTHRLCRAEVLARQRHIHVYGFVAFARQRVSIHNVHGTATHDRTYCLTHGVVHKIERLGKARVYLEIAVVDRLEFDRNFSVFVRGLALTVSRHAFHSRSSEVMARKDMPFVALL